MSQCLLVKEGYRCLDLEPAARPGTGAQGPAIHGCPLAHPDDPVGRARCPAAGSCAVVVYRDPHRCSASDDSDASLGIGPGVLEYVGQRLLHDPVDRQRYSGRQLQWLHLEPYLQATRAQARDELAYLIEPRSRAQLRLCVRAQHGQHAAHLRKRLPAGGRDPAQEGRNLVRVRPGRGLRLDRDQADRMADDVVQLTGDAQPFIHDCPGGAFTLFRLQPRRAVFQFRHVVAPGAERVPQNPARRRQRPEGERGQLS